MSGRDATWRDDDNTDEGTHASLWMHAHVEFQKKISGKVSKFKHLSPRDNRKKEPSLKSQPKGVNFDSFDASLRDASSSISTFNAEDAKQERPVIAIETHVSVVTNVKGLPLTQLKQPTRSQKQILEGASMKFQTSSIEEVPKLSGSLHMKEETKLRESTVKKMHFVEEITALVPSPSLTPSKKPRQSSQLQISEDVEKQNPRATDDKSACAVQDDTSCKFGSEQTDTLDTPTSPSSNTIDIAQNTEMGSLSQNSVGKNPSLHEIARQMTSMLSQMSSRFASAPVKVSLLTNK